MEKNALKELYIDKRYDIYRAGNPLVKALPRLAEAATSDDLLAGFQEHWEQTKRTRATIWSRFSLILTKSPG